LKIRFARKERKMTEEKQIEEMAKAIDDIASNAYIENYDEAIADADKIAEALYNAGYRKQSENTMELPCKLGDKVWCIYNYTNPKEFRITTLTISENHYAFVIEADKGIYKHYCDKDSAGKYVFFTKEEAENALAKMKGGEQG
jgi:hypothetical protein